MDYLTTKEVAARLGVTIKRVQAMIRDERLPAVKVGRDYLVLEADLSLVADRKPGRPPKTQAEGQAGAEKNVSRKASKITNRRKTSSKARKG